MNDNEKLLTRFYEAFRASNFREMQKCYHKDIEYNDPFFRINGKRAQAMWHMLLEKKGNPKTKAFNNVRANDDNGSVSWNARYMFSITKRFIHNEVEAEFVFKDGKIISHKDSFNMYSWCKMAFGFVGIIFGWSFYFQIKLKRMANKRLDSFIKRHPQYKE